MFLHEVLDDEKLFCPECDEELEDGDCANGCLDEIEDDEFEEEYEDDLDEDNLGLGPDPYAEDDGY